MSADVPVAPVVGDEVVLEVERVAHGGHCVGRWEDPAGQRRVVFVRHCLPGEQVVARITEVGRRGRFFRADAVSVLRPSPDRVEPPCRYAGPGGCGGCDFQHASLPSQRRLKADVVAEALDRFAGLDAGACGWDGRVHALADVDPTAPGMRWRTRSRFLVQDEALAMRRHRSTETVPVADCLIVDAELVAASQAAANEMGEGAEEEILARRRSGSEPLVGPAYDLREVMVSESVQVGGSVLDFTVAADGFWQVHPAAAQTLAQYVVDSLQPRPGEAVFDLYAGVGLFAGALAAAADNLGGPLGRVDVVEGDRRAVRMAGDNLADHETVGIHRAGVGQWLEHSAPKRVDLVVLDPPARGCGPEVLSRILRRGPRRVAYVACDPVSLARDLATAAEHGYVSVQLDAWDMFPMTHHVECVAILARV